MVVGPGTVQTPQPDQLTTGCPLCFPRRLNFYCEYLLLPFLAWGV